MKRQLWLALSVALLVGMVGYSIALAQDKTLIWERYDVNLTVQQNSDILVEERQQIAFTSGTFRFGFAAIPLDRVERITDVSVSEITASGERTYTPNSQNEFGFTTATNEGNLEITWYFPATSNSTHTYILRYRVVGGLRIYDGGDQVWWKAIPPDHNFPIRNAQVTVMPPATFPKNELTVNAYGAPINNDPSYTDRGAVVFSASNIPAGEELEVRVQFPHGVVEGTAPSWQAADDRRQQWGPIIGVVSGALGLILLFGGPVGVYMLWYTRGRDTDSPLAPEYVTEPPSDLPAGVVGTLIDEHADMKDIIASILDLAERGALRMEEQKKDTFLGLGVSREFIFHLEDESKAFYPHEERLLSRIFGKTAKTGKERKLRDLRQKFYTAIPDLRRMLYDEVVKQGYFASNPDTTRQRWRGLAILGLIVSGGASFCLLFLLGPYSPAVACPGLALVASMVALIFVSRHMPRKTPEGAEEAAKWLAFKRYLEKIEEFEDLEAVKDKFEQYLPYAMAFGLERRLIHKFSAIDTPAPRWWGPVMPYGHYPGYGGRGRSTGGDVSGGPPGPLAGEGGGMPSLSGMSESIGTSLSSMSDGLGSLLSSASSTLTSRPSSSSSGSFGGGFSGGGFSGGGSFGGGGGGGGSRGFG